MAQKPKPVSGGRPRQPIPLPIIRGDMANGCVPFEYLQSLIKPGTKQQEATSLDLRDNPNPDDIRKLSSVVSSAKISCTIISPDRERFVGLATEAILCGVGSVGVLDPGQIAYSYISATARGVENTFVNEYLTSLDVIFLDALLAPVVTGYIGASPEAAHHFFSLLKTIRYMSRTHFVLDTSAHYRLPAKDRPQIADAIAQVYGYDTANLLLADALTL